jgi:hypothetical protein
LESRLSAEQKRGISGILMRKLRSKGVNLYRVRVPQDPDIVPAFRPTGRISDGTPFDNRMKAADAILEKL